MANFQDSWRSGGTGRGPFILIPRTTGEIPLILRGIAGQTANLLEVQNSALTVVFSIDNSGNLSFAGSGTITIDTTVTGNLTVNGNATLGNAASDTLTVIATSTFSNPVTFSSTATFNGAVTANAGLTSNTLAVTGSATVGTNLVVGGTTSTQALSVTGSTSFGSATRFADGTAAAPSITFTADTDTGFYRSAGNTLGFTVNGVSLATWTTGLLSINAGDISWSAGVAVTATRYSVSRDADAPNQLHFNVPTGGKFEWSTNDVAGLIFNNSASDKLQIIGGNLLLDNTFGLREKDSGGVIRSILSFTSGNNLQLSNEASTGSVQIINANDSGIIQFRTGAGQNIVGSISATGDYTLTQTVSITGSPTFLAFTGAAHTTLTAATEAIDINFALGRTVQFSTGNLGVQRAINIAAPTYAFVGASTITQAVTLAIVSPPLAGTNATITEAVGLFFGDNASAADISSNIQMTRVGISNSTGTVTTRAGIHFLAKGSTLGNQTATLTNWNLIRLEQHTLSSTTLTRTVTNPATLFVQTPILGTNTIATNGPWGIDVSGATTIANVAGTITSAINISDYTLTLSSITQITSVGPAGMRIGQITIAQSGGAVTVDNAASLYIANAHTNGASVTLTNPYAVWSDAGTNRFDGSTIFGTTITPQANDGAALGTTALMWSDLFLASGSVINFNNGDVTITHSVNALDIDGGVVDFGSVPTVNGSALARAADNLSFFAATTSAQLAGIISDETGSGLLVFATSPTLTTPILGVASATTINKVTLTTPATGSTLTIADGKTLTSSNTLTLTGTDGSSISFGAGGTVVYTANNLSVFAATTSAQLAGVISDETGSGALVFATSPSLTTPTLGVAAATSIAFGGGTALANYVEATFTPTVTLVGGAGNTVPVYSTNTGRYTRVGNRVFVDIYLTGDGGAEGAGTGTFTVAIPIAANASFPASYFPVGFFANGTAEDPLWGQIAAGASVIDFAYEDVLNNFVVMTGAEQNNVTRTVRLKFSYEV